MVSGFLHLVFIVFYFSFSYFHHHFSYNELILKKGPHKQKYKDYMYKNIYKPSVHFNNLHIRIISKNQHNLMILVHIISRKQIQSEICIYSYIHKHSNLFTLFIFTLPISSNSWDWKKISTLFTCQHFGRVQWLSIEYIMRHFTSLQILHRCIQCDIFVYKKNIQTLTKQFVIAAHMIAGFPTRVRFDWYVHYDRKAIDLYIYIYL